MTTPSTCIFCQIIAGEAPAKIYYQDDRITAFQDTHPLAPVHILVVTNAHFDDVTRAGDEHEALLGHLMTIASRLAREHGIHENGFRLMVNTGAHAGQSVQHLHLHLLGGRHLPMRFDP